MARGSRHKSAPGRTPTHQDTGDDPDVKDDKIKVVVRVRPLNSSELAGCSRPVVRVVGEQMLVFDPKEEATPEYFQGKARRQRDISKRAARDVKFMFDHVFDSDSNTMQLFENTTMKILDGIMDGYNCSVFAYGATGAGKTHTMLGSSDTPGVIFLTMMDLYRRMEEVKDTKTCDIAVSYLEVYNEQIRDLLMPGGYLPVREDPNRGVTIAGLSLHKPYCADELMHMLRIGNSNRTQHPTDANAESSRSHAVFQVFVRQRDRTANTSADWRVAKMSLIDLAGSERATVTKNRGARFREGANINRSLLALGNCINALADGKSKGYVPYRNSKLTRLLKDSLGGNCRTVMIAAVSPSSMSFEDTYNTLRYADRAKNIKVGLTRNVLSVDLHVSRYVQVIEDLRKEVNELKIKLRTTESGVVAASEYSPDLTTKAIFERLFTSLESVFKARIEIRKEMLELESSCRDLQYKVHRKQLMLTRITLIVPGEKEVSECLQRGIKGAERRRQNIEKRRQAQQTRMADNVAWLQQVEEEMEKSRPNNTMAEALDQNLRSRHLEVELRDRRRQAKYMKKLCRAQEREAHTMEKFNTQLLRTVYSQYMLIKGHNLASYKEIEQFETVQHMACQNMDRSVAWADQSFGAGDDHGLNAPVTPGPSQHCGDLDLVTLLEFPILMGTPISPSKTPHHKPSIPAKSCTPSNKNMSGTPSSGRRRRRTPRRTPQSARCGQSNIPTPAKTVTTNVHSPEALVCPAQKLFAAAPFGANSARNASFTSEDGVFPLQLSPVGNPAVARCGGPPQPPHRDVAHGAVCPQQQQQQHQQQQQQQQQTDPRGAHIISQSAINPSQHPERCRGPVPVASHQPNVEPRRHGELEESVQRFMDSTIVLGPAVAIPCEQTSSHATLDSTVVIDSAVIRAVNSRGLPLPVASSPPQIKESELVNSRVVATPKRLHTVSVTPDSVINSGTVTKCRPALLGETVTKVSSGARSNTVTKLIHGSATITKSKPNDENATPPNDSVVRAMNFGHPNCRDPSGLLSFADVVKSPAPSRVQQLQFDQPPRSPLASRDNIPASNLIRSNFGSASTGKTFLHGKEASRMLSQPLQDNPNARRHTVVHNRRVAEATETLRKFGIPSMLDKSAIPKAKGGPGTPGYMKSTKASSRHNRHHRRSITAEEGYKQTGLAQRNLLVQNENAPPGTGPGPRRTLIKSRSKSTVSLGMRKGFL